MTDYILDINKSLDAFYATAYLSERETAITPICRPIHDINSSTCSILYRLLLDRYPDLSCNSIIPATLDYLPKKLAEIQRSSEYNQQKQKYVVSLDPKRSILVSLNGSLLLQADNAPSPAPSPHFHLLRVSRLLFASLGVYPTNVLYAFERFFVLEGRPCVQETLLDVYAKLKDELLFFSCNDFNRMKLASQIVCPFSFFQIASNYLHNHIPDFLQTSAIGSNAKNIFTSFITAGLRCDFSADLARSRIYLIDFENSLRDLHTPLSPSELPNTDLPPDCAIHSFDLISTQNRTSLSDFLSALSKDYRNSPSLYAVFVKDRVAFFPKNVAEAFDASSGEREPTPNLFLPSLTGLQKLVKEPIHNAALVNATEYLQTSRSTRCFLQSYQHSLQILAAHACRIISILQLLHSENDSDLRLRVNPIAVINSCYTLVLGRRCDTKSLLQRVALQTAFPRNFTYHILSELILSKEYNENLHNTLSASLTDVPSGLLAAAPATSRKMSIKYYGPAGTSGYAICCKLIVWGLYHIGLDIQFVMLENYHPSALLNEFDLLLQTLTRNQLPFHDIVIIHSLPSAWDKIRIYEKSRNPNVRVYGITVWESERLPRSWIEPMSKVDMISCPCDYNKRIFEIDIPRTVAPVVTVHHPIIILQTEIDDQHMTQIYRDLNVSNETYKFYTINELNGRKGLSELIHLYCETFSADHDVLLYVKTSQHQTPLEISQFLDKIRISLSKTLPKIYIDQKVLSEMEITAIHTLNDCFISLSKAEGTGYSGCQAALLGKPVIISNYSATPEYIKYAEFVDVDIVPASFCDPNFSKHKRCTPTRCIHNPLYDSSYQVWGQPKADQVREKMMHCYSQRIRRGDPRSTEYIEKNFNLISVAEKFTQTFEALLKN